MRSLRLIPLLPCKAGKVAAKPTEGASPSTLISLGPVAAAKPPPSRFARFPSPATPKRKARVLGLASALLLLIEAPALAGQPVELRADAAGHAGVVTLGDLFDGAEGASASRVVGRAPAGTQAVLDAGEVQLAAHAAGLDWANGAGQRRIIVSVVAGSATGRAIHRARHARRVDQVLVYARNISPGEVLQASDLEWSQEAVAAFDTPTEAEAVIGMAARAPLRSGAAVSTHALVAAKVIRRDQMISVDYSADGVTLSLAAKALGDAAAGDAVQAMNLSSKKVIEAVATSPGHAAVGPGADEARSATFRTAANP